MFLPIIQHVLGEQKLQNRLVSRLKKGDRMSRETLDQASSLQLVSNILPYSDIFMPYERVLNIFDCISSANM